MEIIKQPPAVHTAFNPVVLKMTDSSATEVTISLTVNETVYTKKKELFNKEVIFDLSTLLKSLFTDSVTISSISDKILIDTKLFLGYSVTAAGTKASNTAVNAVVQIGESSDLTSKRGTFLTKLDRILLYEGYERLISCLGFAEGSFFNYGGTPVNENQITPITDTVFCAILEPCLFVGNSNQYPEHFLQANTGEVITNERGEIITISDPATGYVENRLAVESCCIPLNPFYVRWINQQGGYDYWMFSFRQTIKEKVKIATSYSPTFYDQETATGTPQILNLDSTATITVGASGLTENEYVAVSRVIYSPHIEYFDTTLGTWLSLNISDTDTDKDTYNPTQEIELTFSLPTPQIQF